MSLRKLVVEPRHRGFWSGVADGMGASASVFEARRGGATFQYRALDGLRVDAEAMRDDVRRAKHKLAVEGGRRRKTLPD